MHRLTITVAAAEELDPQALYSALAEKLEAIAEELRAGPSHSAFSAFGAGGVQLHYRLDSDTQPAPGTAAAGALELSGHLPYIAARR